MFSGERRWSDLPELVLFTVAKFLTNPSDFSSFSRACSSWRSASKAAEREFLGSQPPWLCTLEYNCMYSMRDGRFYIKYSAEDRECRKKWTVGFFSGHLILADCTLLHQLFLVNPLTGETSHEFPKAPYAFSRAVLITSPSPDGSDDSELILILYNSSSMQYCRSTGDTEWGVYLFPDYGHVRNMSAFEGKVYALTVDGKLATIDFTPHPQLHFLNSQLLPFGRLQGTWLGACGEILLGITCTYRTTPPRAVDGFIVRRFDFSNCNWVRMTNLGRRTVFLDTSWGLVSTKQPKLDMGHVEKTDTIYFTDPMSNSLRWFDVKDGKKMGYIRTPDPPDYHRNNFRWDLSVWIIPSVTN